MLTSRKTKAVSITVLLALGVGSTGIALLLRGYAVRDGRQGYVDSSPDRTPSQSATHHEDEFTLQVKQLRPGVSPAEVSHLLPAGSVPELGLMSVENGKVELFSTYCFESHWYCVYLRYPYDGPITDLGPKVTEPLQAVRVYRVAVPPDSYRTRVRHGGPPSTPQRDYAEDFYSVVKSGQPNDLGIENELIQVSPEAERSLVRLKSVNVIVRGPHNEVPLNVLVEALNHEESFVRDEAARIIAKIDRRARLVPILSEIEPEDAAKVRSLLQFRVQ